jgi:hypothetical protein
MDTESGLAVLKEIWGTLQLIGFILPLIVFFWMLFTGRISLRRRPFSDWPW